VASTSLPWPWLEVVFISSLAASRKRCVFVAFPSESHQTARKFLAFLRTLCRALVDLDLLPLGPQPRASHRRLATSAVEQPNSRVEHVSKPIMAEDAARPFLQQGPDDDLGPRLDSASNTTAADPPATDKAWAVAFKANVAITVVSALYFGSTGLNEFARESESGRRLSAGGGGGVVSLVLVVFGIVGLAWAFAWGVLHAAIHYSERILKIAYLSLAGISGVAAVSALATGNWVRCLFPAILCAWTLRVYLKRQSRIRFGSANLKVAGLAVKSMPWTVRAGLLMSGVQVLWVLLSATAAAGTIASLRTVTSPDGSVYRASSCSDVTLDPPARGVVHHLSCMCGGHVVSYNSACAYEGHGFWLASFWLVSLAWGGCVIRNVVTATVTGSVASWWYNSAGRDASPVRGALYRATHGSLGSLCKAAAISAVVSLLTQTVRRLAKLGRCGSFVLGWLQGLADYVLAYSICFISIYGLSYSEANQRVSELFRRRGVTTIANDIVVDVGLTAICVGLTVCFLAFAYLVIMANGVVFGGTFLVGFVAYGTFLFGSFMVAFVVATTVEVLRSSFKAVFVCFVQ
ncbi:unnamed protein product, partial [Ectocarpus fasciculatus]